MLESKKQSHKQSWERKVLRTVGQGVQPRPKSLILKKLQRLIQAVEPDKKSYKHAAGIKTHYGLVSNRFGAAKKHWLQLVLLIVIYSTALICVGQHFHHWPSPPCCKPKVCLPQMDGRGVYPQWRRQAAVGRMNPHLCWWRASGHVHWCWSSPRSPKKHNVFSDCMSRRCMFISLHILIRQ